MPDHTITDHALRLVPWIIGLAITVIGVAIRNEWTTNLLKQAIFRENGDIRLVRQQDCNECRTRCQEGIEKALQSAKEDRMKERTETRQDIQKIHDKIDELPLRIIRLMRETRRPSERPEANI